MKIHFINQLDMQWVNGFSKAFEDHQVTWKRKPNFVDDDGNVDIPDVRVFMWLYPEVVAAINDSKIHVKNVLYIRRFEFYSDLIEAVNYDKVDAVIMVNDFLAEGFHKRTGVKPEVVYNAVNPDEWRFKERGHGKNIAWVGFVNKKKNLPLALQVMNELPRHYTLHVAGAFQCGESVDYCVHLAKKMGIHANFYQQVKPEYMDAWLDDKNYILNTSISEGCPNSVIEAMAKGIKPVVHNWPGADRQFKTFDSVPEAVLSISSGKYDSHLYRQRVENQFGPSNYNQVKKIIEAVM